jgi:hypothetical protein
MLAAVAFAVKENLGLFGALGLSGQPPKWPDAPTVRDAVNQANSLPAVRWQDTVFHTGPLCRKRFLDSETVRKRGNGS